MSDAKQTSRVKSPGKPARTVARAKSLRRAMTLPEVLLWQRLRHRPDGLKFRRQHPVGVYIADFYCPEAALVVEVDGEHHHFGSKPAHDARRDAWLRARGIRTWRIAASRILHELDDAVDNIVHMARGRLEAA